MYFEVVHLNCLMVQTYIRKCYWLCNETTLPQKHGLIEGRYTNIVINIFNMGWYAHLVTRYPWLVILLDVVIVIICGPIAVWQAGLPDFSDPNKGFEPRGTVISGWELANTELMAQIYSGQLSYFPWGNPVMNHSTLKDTSDVTQGNGSAEYPTTPSGIADSAEVTTARDTISYQECSPEKLEGVTARILPRAIELTTEATGPEALPRFVVEAKDSTKSLWSPANMKAICDLESTYISGPLQRDCQAHTLPYYVGLISDKTCGELTQEDLDKYLTILKECSGYYFSGHLQPSKCSPANAECVPNDSSLPQKCLRFNAVYNTLYYLTDVDFIQALNQSNGETPNLSYTQVIFRRSWTVDEEELYDYFLDTIAGKTLDNDLVRVAGIKMHMAESTIYTYYVFQDLPLYGVAMALVVLVLFLYLRSFLLTLIVVLNVGLSLLVSYFIYHVVCRFIFFGFTNLLAALLLIAIGADDVFIFFDIWHAIKNDMTDSTHADLEEITSKTLYHAVLSILVTSLTTSAALFANGISSVITLRCFGIFGGICIIVNLFFMVTLTPAVLVLIEKAERKHPKVCGCMWAHKCTNFIGKISKFVWHKVVPFIVMQIWPFWLITLLGLGIYGFVAVFYLPKLDLPKTEIFQYLNSDSPFEVYNLQMREKFVFEIENTQRSRVEISLNFIFGVKGEDNGNFFDPDEPGTLRFDPDFEIFSEQTQVWLHRFCTELLEDEMTRFPQQYACFPHLVERVISSPCFYQHFNITLNSLCCEGSFPLSMEQANFCLRDSTFIQQVYALAAAQNQTILGGPVYDNDKGLKAVIFKIETKQKWSALYHVMDVFYSHMEDFMNSQLEDAPDSVNGGWFIGSHGRELFFYDLMASMVRGIVSGIALAMGIAFLVMLITSMNFYLTLYAIVTIVFVIVVTIALLVHLGWGLDVSEAIVITLAVGLSIDFTIHFGVAYKVSDREERRPRVKHAITSVGFAVTMAALTTFLAGAALIGGRVLSFYRFGLFLMLDMTVSWIYSLLFFLPLCLFIGPVGQAGELSQLFCCKGKSHTVTEKTLLSSGSVNSGFQPTAHCDDKTIDVCDIKVDVNSVKDNNS